MEKNISYDEISKNTKVWEESEVPRHNSPMQNDYEKARNSDFNQSGFGKGK